MGLCLFISNVIHTNKHDWAYSVKELILWKKWFLFVRFNPKPIQKITYQIFLEDREFPDLSLSDVFPKQHAWSLSKQAQKWLKFSQKFWPNSFDELFVTYIGPIAEQSKSLKDLWCGRGELVSNLCRGIFFSRHAFLRFRTNLKPYCLLQHMSNNHFIIIYLDRCHG